MSDPGYERLSAADNAFLLFESPEAHMHVGSTLVCRAGPLATPEGGIDADAIRRALASALERIPRYRQKLAWIPFEQHAVWVDDPHFQLEYHVRHTSLPRPGNDEQLKRLSARILSQPLDRRRPLWEMWVVEGLEGDRFALIGKVHHCMIDGASGVDIAHILLSNTPEVSLAPAAPFAPRPAPSPARLWRDEALRRASLPVQALRGVARLATAGGSLTSEASTRLRALRELLGQAANPPSETSLNGPIGPHRRFDWLTLSLDRIKAVRRAQQCSVNDVVLTTVTGAVREHLAARGEDPAATDFRVSTPVNVRGEDERGQLGNRVSSWIVRLPLEEADPLRQLRAVRRTTEALKESRQSAGVETFMALAEWLPAQLLGLASGSISGPINSIVTNVPGPPMPLYLLGAELLAMYPQVPLLPNLGLGIAVLSYNGQVGWGFNADDALVPDLPEFVARVEASFERLESATGAARRARAEVRRRARPAVVRPASGPVSIDAALRLH